jgi:pimeloyl-ACP methyl ester carboxylesterase
MRIKLFDFLSTVRVQLMTNNYKALVLAGSILGSALAAVAHPSTDYSVSCVPKVTENGLKGTALHLPAGKLSHALPSRGSTQSAALEAPPLDGLWKGQLKLPGGQLEVIFRLMKLTSGEYFATLDVPLQKVSHLPVEATMRADTVSLVATEANSHFTGLFKANGQQLQGTWQQPGFQVPLTLTHSALPVEATAPAPRLTPPYREENVTFPNSVANLRLAGTLTVPAGVGPFPAVALLSDIGPHDRNGTVGNFAPLGRLADYLTRRGIAVLRFDDRGVGQSTGAAHASATELVSDAQAALSFLRTRPDVDVAHLGLLGHGEGGNVALLAAAQPLPPAFVVGLAPYGLTGLQIALQQQEDILHGQQTTPEQMAAALRRQQLMLEVIEQTADKSQAKDIVANMLRQNNPALDLTAARARAAEMFSPSYPSFLAFNPVETLPKVACSVLLLYGADDTMLAADNNLNALTKGLKAANKVVVAHKLPGVNHLFQPEPGQWPIINGESKPNFSPTAQDAIRTWIVEQVAKK